MDRRVFLQSGALGVLSTRIATRAPRPARERGKPAPIRLSANENPLGPSPAAKQAVIDGLANAHRYPMVAGPLIESLAKKHKVATEQIVLGAGSSEVLQMAVQSFARRNATFVIAEPTFEDVQTYAEPWELKVVRVPLAKGFGHDIPRMRALAESAEGPAVVYICNPNNPTGTITPARELDEWIEASSDTVTFLIDEAYYEFAVETPGFGSAVKWVDKRDNVIVTRTFSKIYGMAGMRLGYGLARRETASRLRVLQSHNDCSSLALLAGQACLQDDEHLKRTLTANAKARDLVEGTLRELELGWMPGATNFVFHEIRGSLTEYISRMREAGIYVGRPFPPLLTYNRVSLGTLDEMGRWAEAIRDFRKQGWV